MEEKIEKILLSILALIFLSIIFLGLFSLMTNDYKAYVPPASLSKGFLLKSIFL